MVPKNPGGLTQKLDSLAPWCSPFLSGMSSSLPSGLASLLSSRPPSGSSQPHPNQAWHLEPAGGWNWLLPRAGREAGWGGAAGRSISTGLCPNHPSLGLADGGGWSVLQYSSPHPCPVLGCLGRP